MDTFLPLIRLLIPQERRQRFDEGVKAIREYGQTHQVRSMSDAIEALAALNVPKDFLSNTGGLVNNPVVSRIASVCNVDLGKIHQDVENLSKGGLDPLKRDLDVLDKLK